MLYLITLRHNIKKDKELLLFVKIEISSEYKIHKIINNSNIPNQFKVNQNYTIKYFDDWCNSFNYNRNIERYYTANELINI